MRIGRINDAELVIISANGCTQICLRIIKRKRRLNMSMPSNNSNTKILLCTNKCTFVFRLHEINHFSNKLNRNSSFLLKTLWNFDLVTFRYRAIFLQGIACCTISKSDSHKTKHKTPTSKKNRAKTKKSKPKLKNETRNYKI